MTLHIYFYGLISFIGNGDKKSMAVLITYPGHRPEIVTEAESTTAHDGKHIVLLNAPAGGAVATADFNAYIPSLSTLVTPGSQLKDSVAQGTDNANVNAFIHLPAGDLHVADLYKTQGEFVLGGRIARKMDCVCRMAYISVSTPSPVFVIGCDKQITVPQDGWLLIQNTCAKGDKDFKAHRAITTAADVATIIEGEPCDLSTKWPKPPFYDKVFAKISKDGTEDISQIECSNSRWP